MPFFSSFVLFTYMVTIVEYYCLPRGSIANHL